MSTKEGQVFIKKEALAQIPWAVCGKMIGVFLAAIVSILLVRTMSTVEFGRYSLYFNIAESVAVLSQFGMSVAITRFLPELLSFGKIKEAKSLLQKVVWIQLLFFLFIFFLFWWNEERINIYFKQNISDSLLPVFCLVFALLLKELSAKTLTVFYRMKLIALVSFLYLTLFFIGILFARHFGALSGYTIALIQAFCVFFISFLSLYAVYKLFQHKEESSQDKSIRVPFKRVLRITIPSSIGALLNILKSRYTEIFFIGYFVGVEEVGFYTLGFFLSYTLITLVPLSAYNLLSSSVSEAYSLHPESFGNLMRGMYFLLIVFSLPIAGGGMLFLEPFALLIYGAKMATGANLATLLVPIQVLNLISLPIGIGLVVKEKNLEVLWLSFLMVAFNLIANYFFIGIFGLYGAVFAVYISFILTIPIRLIVIIRYLGGVFFPLFFFLKMLIITFISVCFSYLFIETETFFYLSISVLFYFLVYFIVLRYSRIIKKFDFLEIEGLRFKKIEKLLHLILG